MINQLLFYLKDHFNNIITLIKTKILKDHYHLIKCIKSFYQNLEDNLIFTSQDLKINII